jgi:7-keto-8-aminopelargonate synthetase-like enzyme
MRQSLQERIGLLGRGGTQIAPVLVGDDRRVMECTKRLLDAGLFVQGIRPPTVPEGTARLRVAMSASLEIEDVVRLRGALDELTEAGLVPRGTAMR